MARVYRKPPQVLVSFRLPVEMLAYLDAVVAHYQDSGRPWTRSDVIALLLGKMKAPEGLDGMKKAAFPEGPE